MNLVVTITGNSDDLRFIRDRIDGAVQEILEENESRFDEPVEHSIEYAGSDE